MLDASVYLTSFGWKGKGNGLRQGSASRPLAIPQKRTLAGLGKDREEAFPFWDHLFAAAAKSIQIKMSGEEVGDKENATLLRTTTGILSNRRPTTGKLSTSGSVASSDSCPIPRLSLLAAAKRESARERLYAAFFKGPILGLDVAHDTRPTGEVEAESVRQVRTLDVPLNRNQDGQGRHETAKKNKKRKRDDVQIVDKGKYRQKRTDYHDGESEITTAQEVHKGEGICSPKTKQKKEHTMLKESLESPEEKRKRKKALKAKRRKAKEKEEESSKP